jgi:predicted nucleotide-binding protein
MASRRSALPAQAPVLTADQKRRRIDRLQRCIDELGAFNPELVQKRYREPEVMRLEAAVDEALAAAFGHGTTAYNRYRQAAKLDHGPHTARMGSGFGRGPEIDYDAMDARDARRYFAEGKVQSVALLRQAISTLEDEIADQEPDVREAPRLASFAAQNRKIFIVHGRQEGPREAVARFLERLGFQPIILHEQANQGRTVIEKVEAHSDVGFAVIILTPDDMGNLQGEVAQPRARQNVLLELGYFIGKLTRGRVCTLKVGELEIPSDWRGVVDEPYDAGGGWKQTLARELEAAEYEVDWNKVMRS